MNNFCSRRKFIYLHPPKTAGKTLELLFFNQEPKPSTSNHNKLQTMMDKKVQVDSYGLNFKQLLEGHKHLINDWTIIISVRNPWARMVSTYFQGNMKESKTSKEPSIFLKYGKMHGPSHSFKEWVLDSKNPVESQVKWLETEHKTFEPDYIIRLESFESDYNKIPRKFRHDKQSDVNELPKLNPSRHEHYSTYYDDETKEYIAQKYSEDITRFNYTFDIY